MDFILGYVFTWPLENAFDDWREIEVNYWVCLLYSVSTITPAQKASKAVDSSVPKYFYFSVGVIIPLFFC